MRDRECGRFLERLDRREAGYAADPHPRGCAACGAQLRSAIRIDSVLASRPAADPRGLSRPAGDAPAAGFASRIATIASSERRSEPRESAARRLLGSTAFVTTVALTATAVSVRLSIPQVVGTLRIPPIRFEDPAGLAGVALGILACVAIGAIAGARLARRAV